MKKLLLTSIVAIGFFAVNAQNASKKVELGALEVASSITTQNNIVHNRVSNVSTTACGTDTSMINELGYDPNFRDWKIKQGLFTGWGHYFPAGVKNVTGVKFYANTYGAPSYNVRIKIYEALADSSMGSALDSSDVTIVNVTPLNTLVAYRTSFTAPVAVTGGYFVTIESNTAPTDSAFIWGVNNGKGNMEDNCMLNYSTFGWFRALSGGGIDMNVTLEPVVNYDVAADFSTSANPTANAPVNFINLSGNVVNEKAYNVNKTALATTGDITYAWDFGDGSTSAEQTPSHTYTADGTYQVKLVAKLLSWASYIDNVVNSADLVYCSDSVTIPVVILPTGIKDANAAKAFSFYPNPSKGEVSINSSNIISTVTVVDIIGNRVSAATVNNNTYKADLHNIAKGVYFLTVKFSNGNVATKKLTISE